MATTPRLITFDEWEQIPNPPGGRYELHHGELVEVSSPLGPHVRAQWRLRRLLEPMAESTGIVHSEVPFRPLPEYEGWFADVAYVTKSRWDGIVRCLEGAPELVIEVLSPSNRASEMLERERLCLGNGSVEFWVVDLEAKQVRVSTNDGRVANYQPGQSIPLFFAPGSSIEAASIFA